MGSSESSFFERFFDSDNSEDINFEHVQHKCDPDEKSFVLDLFDKLAERYAEKRGEKAKLTKQPPTTPIKTEADDKPKKEQEPPKVESSKLPTELSPRCFIKEQITNNPHVYNVIFQQNPLAPLCCEVKSKNDDDDDGPCPPPGYPQDPRVPSCGCDRCRKSGYHGRCCDRRTYVRQSADEPPRLEKA